MKTILGCTHTYPHCCCCAACTRSGALFLASAASSFCTVIPGIYVSPVSGVLDIKLYVSAWYQKTRLALLRARCLLLLLLLATDSRERRCAVCGIAFKISCNGAETKERFCANPNMKESRRIKNAATPKHFFIYGNSLYGPASWIHTKGDTSDMPSMQPKEHPRTSPPGSRGSEHMPLYPSCVRLPESSVSRANATGALEA